MACPPLGVTSPAPSRPPVPTTRTHRKPRPRQTSPTRLNRRNAPSPRYVPVDAFSAAGASSSTAFRCTTARPPSPWSQWAAPSWPARARGYPALEGRMGRRELFPERSRHFPTGQTTPPNTRRHRSDSGLSQPEHPGAGSCSRRDNTLKPVTDLLPAPTAIVPQVGGSSKAWSRHQGAGWVTATLAVLGDGEASGQQGHPQGDGPRPPHAAGRASSAPETFVRATLDEAMRAGLSRCRHAHGWLAAGARVGAVEPGCL